MKLAPLLVYKGHQLMVHRKIIIVYSEFHTILINLDQTRFRISDVEHIVTQSNL